MSAPVGFQIVTPQQQMRSGKTGHNDWFNLSRVFDIFYTGTNLVGARTIIESLRVLDLLVNDTEG